MSQHVIVGHAHDADAVLVKHSFATPIGLPPTFVTQTVYLDGQSQFRAVEVKNERLGHVLPLESEAAESTGTQNAPELPFGEGHLATQPASALGQFNLVGRCAGLARIQICVVIVQSHHPHPGPLPH